MTLAINIQLVAPKIHRQTTVKVAGNLIYPPSPAKILRIPPRRFTVTSVQSSENAASISSEPSISSQFTTSVASPSIQFTLTQRHFTVLNVAACAVAISATWLFCSAIPTLLAFKRAAESLEKLLDVTREELPDTMAAVRLSGMEISDLTTEISDLGYFLADTLVEEVTFGWPKQKGTLQLRECLASNLARPLNSVGLNGIPLDKDPQSLSGGCKRRLALAIQLVQAPELLILDEPLAGLSIETVVLRLFISFGRRGMQGCLMSYMLLSIKKLEILNTSITFV